MRNLDDVKSIHFIGIGGISMSSLALTLHTRGYRVSGSDKSQSETTDRLSNSGIEVFIGHEAENVRGRDLVVYTGAISKENSEIAEAKRLGIPIIRRTELIDYFLAEHKINIAVSGTHGKSTTSSMITAILESVGASPDFLIGAIVPPFNSSHRLDGSNYLVLEACEYQANFLDFYPSTIIINNIDYDHVDYYNSIEEVADTFEKFAHNLEENGKLIINIDDKYAAMLYNKIDLEAYSFGIKNEADFMAKNIELSPDKIQSYDFYAKGEKVCKVNMSIIGMQNVYNSLGAFASLYLNGIDISKAANALVDYHNALRRFELIRRENGASLISDYAHHPAEIRATLSTARSICTGKLVVAFQPHTFTRTKKLLSELASSFDAADLIYIADIDPIREEDIYGISSKDLVDLISARGKDVVYLGPVSEFNKVVNENLSDENMVIAMGAGAIDHYARLS